MIYGPNGQRVASVKAGYSRPEPQPEAEARVREQLKSIDSLLDVRWYPYAIYISDHNTFEGRYALVCQWPTSDPRWQFYQSGEIEDPVDMLGWFCENMQDAHSMPVSVDSIERKVIELLGKCDGTRIPHATRMRQILEKNAKVRQAQKNEMSDRAEEVARTLWNLTGKVDDSKLEQIMKEIGDRTTDG